MDTNKKQPHTMRRRRRVVELLQAALILGLPFARVNGESALRFDLPTLRLHALGCTLWMHELFLALAASVFLTFFIVFVTLVFGRVWCGWLCPQTVLVDFTPFMDRPGNKGVLARAAAHGATAAASAIVAASLIWYFVSPYEFIPELFAGGLGATTWGFWAALTAAAYFNFAFLRHKWCATACPYAKLQSILYDQSTLLIELDPARAKECVNCLSCVRACPTGLDIRKGADAACINCAECLDACAGLMGRLGKRGLIRYAFGPGGGGTVRRRSVFATGGALLVVFSLTVWLALSRTGLEVTVLPHAMEPRLTQDGRVINGYVLAIKNTRSTAVDLTVSVERFAPGLKQSVTAPIHLDAGTRDRFPLFVRIDKPSDKPGTRRIRVTLDGPGDVHITKEANFTVPDEM